MSQPQPVFAEVHALKTQNQTVADRSAVGLRGANQIDAPVASPVHMLQDKLQRLDEPPLGSESAYVYKVKKAPAWLRLSLPVGLSIGLWLGIFYAVGLIG